jgi:hypothetical protein
MRISMGGNSSSVLQLEATSSPRSMSVVPSFGLGFEDRLEVVVVDVFLPGSVKPKSKFAQPKPLENDDMPSEAREPPACICMR